MRDRGLKVLLQQGFRSLKRERSLPSLRLLFVAAMLSVTAVASILSLSSFMKETLILSSSELLAGDRQLESPREIPKDWLDKAAELGLRHSLAIEFRTMLFSESSSVLVAAKAVDDAYPLKGELLLETGESAQPVTELKIGQGGSAIQARLFNLLGVGFQAPVFVGDSQLEVTARLVQEPDVGFNLGGIQPRLLMSLEDLESTNVLQPGSRAKWRYYFSGDKPGLTVFDDWINKRLNSSQEYHGIQGGRPTIASAMEKAEAYLLLAASLSILLASLAIALCARQYAQQQVMGVAIYKTLGFSPRDVLKLYLFKLLSIWFAALVLGLAVSHGIASLFLDMLAPLFEGVELPKSIGIQAEAIFMSSAITLVSVIGFCMPQIVSLSKVSPQAVLRPESGVLASGSRSVLLTVCVTLFGLLFIYAKSIKLMLLFASASLFLMAFISCVVLVIVFLLNKLPSSVYRNNQSVGLARSALVSVPKKTVFQAGVYAFSLCLLALIFLVRDSLISQWQAQLPVDAPNHFLINISDEQVAGLSEMLREAGFETSKVYPMVRGRLSHINDEDVKVVVTKDVGALNRELNLSWADSLPDDNEIVSGKWFSELDEQRDIVAVSIEQELAENIDVELGDLLSFTIGPDRIETRVTSIRKVQWDSMRPNFYVFFEPGGLRDFPRTYITSFFIGEASGKDVLNALSRSYPTVSILELDSLIEKIQGIVRQVSKMLEVVLSLIVLASLLVVGAITSAKLQERVKEAAIYRSFGVRSSALRLGYLIEFAILGLIASVAGLLCAEIGLNLVTGIFLSGEVVVHTQLWFAFPVINAGVLGVLGYVLLNKSLKQTPMSALR